MALSLEPRPSPRRELMVQDLRKQPFFVILAFDQVESKLQRVSSFFK